MHTVVGVDYLFESKHPTANLKGLHLDFFTLDINTLLILVFKLRKITKCNL